MPSNHRNILVTIKNLKAEFTNPLTLQNFLTSKLPEIDPTIFPIERNSGIHIYFRNKSKFLHSFKEANCGQKAKITEYDSQILNQTKAKTNTTFTGVMRGLPANVKMEDLKFHFKNKFPILNIIRIRNDRGLLPLVRIFTKDPTIISHLITNGISIGINRYKVEESRNTTRPMPCST